MRIAINGLGRIGRAVLREARDRGMGSNIVCLNDLMSKDCLANLIKYDSVHPTLEESVEVEGDGITIGDDGMKATSLKDQSELPWKDLDIDIVVEATGIFRHRDDLETHLEQGADRCILTVPPKDEIDAMVVLGVNDHTLDGNEKIVSMASCTTNCAAPVLKIIHKNFGVKRCTFNTVHAYTNSQTLIDSPHKDKRRARSAPQSMIPTTTGAAKAIGPVIPELKGKIDAFAVRVPVPDGSLVDFTIDVEQRVEAEAVNDALLEASNQPEMKGILDYTEDPVVSVDIIGNRHSSIVDSLMTKVFDGNMLKVLSWYDNEIGYANRVVDMIEIMGKEL